MPKAEPSPPHRDRFSCRVPGRLHPFHPRPVANGFRISRVLYLASEPCAITLEDDRIHWTYSWSVRITNGRARSPCRIHVSVCGNGGNVTVLPSLNVTTVVGDPNRTTRFGPMTR